MEARKFPSFSSKQEVVFIISMETVALAVVHPFQKVSVGTIQGG